MLLCIMSQNDVTFSSASEIHIVYGRDAVFVLILQVGFVRAGLTPVGSSHALAGATASMKLPLKPLPLFKRDFFLNILK